MRKDGRAHQANARNTVDAKVSAGAPATGSNQAAHLIAHATCGRREVVVAVITITVDVTVRRDQGKESVDGIGGYACKRKSRNSKPHFNLNTPYHAHEQRRGREARQSETHMQNSLAEREFSREFRARCSAEYPLAHQTKRRRNANTRNKEAVTTHEQGGGTRILRYIRRRRSGATARKESGVESPS